MDRELEKYMNLAYVYNSELRHLSDSLEGYWGEMLEDLEMASLMGGVYLNAGEGNLLVETRSPTRQTGDYATATQATTSVCWLPLDGTSMMMPKNYWETGKEVRFTMFGKMTTGTTPGNQTIEIRHQNAQPLTNAGGTILATTTAIAAAATKTNISFLVFGRCQSRAIPSTTAGSLFAHAIFLSNQLSVVLPAANIPLLIPETAPAAVGSLDTVTAGGISVQGKNSGANASTVAILDLSVEAMT